MDVNKPEHGIWVQKKIKCDKNECNVRLDDLTGIRYHLIVLESYGKHLSKINKIIKFGDNDPYAPYKIKEQKTNYKVENKKLKRTPTISMNKEEMVEVEAPDPYIECGKNPIIKNLRNNLTLDDIENIEINTDCKEDEEIKKLRQKNKRNLWNEFKKGYLSLDLKLTN